MVIIGLFEITFIDKLNWSERVCVAFNSVIETIFVDTALTGVLIRFWACPKYLLPTISVVPETVLNRVKLEWNR